MEASSRSSRRTKLFFWLVIVPVVLLALYTWFVLSWSYSRGERAGYVQKLSERGWLCKTWEGELALVTMPGTVAEKFHFTVRSDAVAQKINDSIGQRVSLDYEQHIGIPTSCFGDTEYFVTGVKAVQDIAPGAVVAPSPLPQQAPADAAPPSPPPVASPPAEQVPAAPAAETPAPAAEPGGTPR